MNNHLYLFGIGSIYGFQCYWDLEGAFEFDQTHVYILCCSFYIDHNKSSTIGVASEQT